jgi:hypothetical protein
VDYRERQHCAQPSERLEAVRPSYNSVCLKDDTSRRTFCGSKVQADLRQGRPGGRRVWRAKDNNYYIARANALEGNVTIYDTLNGRRTERKRKSIKVDLTSGTRCESTPRQTLHGDVRRKAIEWDAF